MTLDEAKKVALIISTADSGCPGCVDDLTKQMQEAFPEYQWMELVASEEEAARDRAVAQYRLDMANAVRKADGREPL